MKFSVLMDLVKARGVRVVEMGGGDVEILGVCEDSRRARTGDLFVARGGTKTTGEKFVAEAGGQGAVAGVYGENDERGTGNDERGEGDTLKRELRAVAWVRVEDVNFACAILAHEVAGNPTAGMKMIGITGTKGKTTVAYLMRSVLKAAGYKVGMIGTVEIDDGETVVPAEMTTPGVVELVELFGRMRANGVTHVVMEVSSHALHQRRVAGIDFAVGIFTNLTGDHLDYHKTMEEYAAAKAILFEGLKEGAVAVVNEDDAWAERMTKGCDAKVVRFRVANKPRTTGIIPVIENPEVPGDREAGIRAPLVQWVCPDAAPVSGFATYVWRMTSGGMGLSVAWNNPPFLMAGTGHTFVTPLVGRHNAYNIVCVVSLQHIRLPRCLMILKSG